MISRVRNVDISSTIHYDTSWQSKSRRSASARACRLARYSRGTDPPIARTFLRAIITGIRNIQCVGRIDNNAKRPIQKICTRTTNIPSTSHCRSIHCPIVARPIR